MHKHVFVFLIFFGIFFFIFATKAVLDATITNTMCTFTSKENVVTAKSSKYLIFCKEEVFEDVDSLLYLKFNSSDVYNEFEEGKKYVVSVYGWRYPFLSWYRNIIRVTHL